MNIRVMLVIFLSSLVCTSPMFAADTAYADTLSSAQTGESVSVSDRSEPLSSTTETQQVTETSAAPTAESSTSEQNSEPKSTVPASEAETKQQAYDGEWKLVSSFAELKAAFRCERADDQIGPFYGGI